VQSRPNLSAVGAAACFRDPWAFFFSNSTSSKFVACSSHPVFGVLSLQLWVYQDTTGEPRVLFSEAPFVKFMN
jgi:hypothetical protein